MYYEYAYEMEALVASLISGLLSSIPSFAISIAVYILTALGLYTIAKRRGIYHAWMAWVPVVNCWVLGSISDQYHYVVKGENKAKRKSLLILNILTNLTSIIILVVCVIMIVNLFTGVMYDITEEELIARVMVPMLGMLGLCLPMMGFAIAYTVVYYFALYDVYKSLDPSNSVLFLVLSILFNVTTPFFLFFNRHKDLGMPPRRQEPVFMPLQSGWQQPAGQQYQQPTWQQPEQPAPQQSEEPWNQGNKDYL